MSELCLQTGSSVNPWGSLHWAQSDTDHTVKHVSQHPEFPWVSSSQNLLSHKELQDEPYQCAHAHVLSTRACVKQQQLVR